MTSFDGDITSGLAHEVYGIQIRLAQYPILAPRIRERMRQELFVKGIIAPATFEAEVRRKALLSQKLEGLDDPFAQESEAVWQQRLAIIRDQLTDFYFAYNFPPERLTELIERTLTETRTSGSNNATTLTFNPELAPTDLLLHQGRIYEALPPDRRTAVQHHLREIIVVLIKSMLSDNLDYVGIAKEVFSAHDLEAIRRRIIGHGKIGGKAAGILLAQKILLTPDPEDEELDLASHIKIPDSYFIGADVFYDFQMINGFTTYMNQKYRSYDEIVASYPHLQEAYQAGRFPPEVVVRLQQLLEKVGNTPLIVRSSSLLEVHFGAALAGKYHSVFCPNLGGPEENLRMLLRAIGEVYASTLSPEALLYRQQMGLVDYDERMAVLIQKVEGTRYRHFLFPSVAGMGYSQNPFRWDPRIRREDGFLRLVIGFGTRAVQRVGNDFPRIVALSHPELRPQTGEREIRKYSQHYMDVLDLEQKALRTLPVREVIRGDFPALRYVASLDRGDYIIPIMARPSSADDNRWVLTFDRLLKDRAFIQLMRRILKKLEQFHHWPVDIEFTVDIRPNGPRPTYTVNLLQCRPQVSRKEYHAAELPGSVNSADLILRTTELVPHGVVSDIRYIVYVPAHAYQRAQSYAQKLEIARVIGRLNRKLTGTRFVLIGPGRWGSSDINLGVRVTYADIYNAKVLIEVTTGNQAGPEPSYGTHFFQDLLEAGIYPLPLVLNHPKGLLNTAFLERSQNRLTDLLPGDAEFAPFVRVIDVPAEAQGRYLQIVMNSERNLALGYLAMPRVFNPSHSG